jgi:hypothetical protein
MMQVVTYYLLKIVFTLLFVFVIAFAVRELYRLWRVQRITLGTFTYQKDASKNDEQGLAFRQHVYHELRGLQRLFEGGLTSHNNHGHDGRTHLMQPSGERRRA